MDAICSPFIKRSHQDDLTFTFKSYQVSNSQFLAFGFETSPEGDDKTL